MYSLALTLAMYVCVTQILELVGYKVTDGADFKLFSVLVALSHKITSLE